MKFTKLLTDEYYPSSSSLTQPLTIFFLSSIAGIVFTVLFIFRDLFNIEFLYREDGLFESLTAINFFLSSFLIGKVVLELKKVDGFWQKKEFRAIFLALISILVFLFLFGMEEISWGQRIFGWETPDFLSQLNKQNETNIHNIFNPFLWILNFFFGNFFLLALVIAWFTIRPRYPVFYNHVFPHSSLITLAILVFYTSVKYPGELFEELLSLFALFYSVRAFLCFGSSKYNWQPPLLPELTPNNK